MRSDSAPGVLYIVEQSLDSTNWSQVPAMNLNERVIQTDGVWENVECLMEGTLQSGISFRVRVELSQPLSQ